MTTKMHVKTGDTVQVLSGKDKGKKGEILSVNRKKGRVIVSGVNICTKHQKPRGEGNPGGIIKSESTVDASNVNLLCPKCGKKTRTGREVLEDGKIVRVCKKCNEHI